MAHDTGADITSRIDDDLEEESISLNEFDIIAMPNDFNIKTIADFIRSGAVKIPGFQRHYVWDIKRASKLVESLLLGLPIPQVFLYEEARNRFLVIDGQQRLMSIFYFLKGRFPKPEARAHLRDVFNEHNDIPEGVLQDDKFFRDFALQLPTRETGEQNVLHGKKFSTLADLQTVLELKTIRNVIIKQTRPDDDSSIYEIFNRLNSGGINLKPQEIRMALYHSSFYAMLLKMNQLGAWRAVLGEPEPDLHLKDVEILVRSFAMLVAGKDYKPSLVKFINRFSRSAKEFKPEKNALLNAIGQRFFALAAKMPSKSFHTSANRFSVPVFEAVFAAACKQALDSEDAAAVHDPSVVLAGLIADVDFMAATQLHTTGSTKVQNRLRIASEHFAKVYK